MIEGFDVSNLQGGRPWPSGKQFVMIKASEGTSFTDPYFGANFAVAWAEGMVRGAYHFARPSANSGHDEAAFFLRAVGAVGGLREGDLLALDLEDMDVAPDADLLAYAMDFLTTCERALGFKPFLYTGHWYAAPHNLEDHPELAAYPLWEAGSEAVLGWETATIRQYDCSGAFCLDSSLLTTSSLQALGWGHAQDPLEGQPVDPPPTVAVNSSGEATDVNKAAQQISAELLAVYWQLTTIQPNRNDQAAAVMQAKSNVDAIIKVTGLLS